MYLSVFSFIGEAGGSAETIRAAQVCLPMLAMVFTLVDKDDTCFRLEPSLSGVSLEEKGSGRA